MDSFCDNLLLAIFQFVHPDDRFRFILLGKKYHNVVSEYIASPEWIYEQIDQFIKENIVVDFSLKSEVPFDYHEYLQDYDCNEQYWNDCRDSYSVRKNSSINRVFAQQLGINIMMCEYGTGVYTVCCECDTCDWVPPSPNTWSWRLHSMHSAPPNYSSLTNQEYHEFLFNSLSEQLSAKFYVYWSSESNHTSELNIIGLDPFAGPNYDRCTCVGGSIIPIHSVYESIGIIVHNMTGIEQIHKNLFDYDVAHLQLFYIVNFIVSGELSGTSERLRNKRNISASRYSMFARHVLRNRICKNVEMLLRSNRVGPSKYVFMIHPEIETKAAEAAEFVILFLRH